MPIVNINSSIFDTLETLPDLPEIALDHQSALDAISGGDVASDPVVLQLSASLIRIRQDLWVYDPVSGGVESSTFELRVSGAGISPVSNFNALINAIDAGLANGSLNKFAIFNAGIEVLSLSMGTAGYVLASGAQSITLSGRLPLTFSQFYDLADLIDKGVHIEDLTRAQRLDLFDDLASYSISGFAVRDAGQTVFSASITATQASITLNGLTLTATGSFPDNFGEDLSLLWDAAANFRQTADIKTILAFTSADLDLTSLKITNAAGQVLLSVTDPLQDTPETWVVDGRTFDEVLTGDFGASDVLRGGPGYTRSVLAGLDGNDVLLGFSGSDRLYGGTGYDTLTGGGGTDLIDGGTGRDVLTGGTRRDVFDFNLGDGFDRITDFAEGEDVIRILAASRLSDLTFTDVGANVQIDFRTIHILVEGTDIAQLRLDGNFLF